MNNTENENLQAMQDAAETAAQTAQKDAENITYVDGEMDTAVSADYGYFFIFKSL